MPSLMDGVSRSLSVGMIQLSKLKTVRLNSLIGSIVVTKLYADDEYWKTKLQQQ